MTRSGLPKFYWLEAVNSSIYILNRSLTLTIKNKTSEEAWIGWKLSVDHLRVFRCIIHAYIPNQKRNKKLNDKGEKYIFLVINDCLRSYKLYNRNTKKFVISRDVIFLWSYILNMEQWWYQTKYSSKFKWWK